MRVTLIIIITSLIAFGGNNVWAQADVDWNKVATAIPLGSKVKIQTLDGKRIGGTLVRVDAGAVQLKRNARRPEPATLVAFDQISNLEKDNGGGMTWGKALGIGLGVGAGAILTIFVIALQLD